MDGKTAPTVIVLLSFFSVFVIWFLYLGPPKLGSYVFTDVVSSRVNPLVIV